MSIRSRPYFQSEKAAFRHLEAVLWPDGPTCPHCGNTDAKRITRLAGKAHRIGVHKCNECRKQFTVKVGTVFESAHIPLHKMLQAVHLMASSKKGISAHQLHRTLEIQYKSAWFLAHRIREAMRTGNLGPMGGPGGVVEVDETHSGKIEGAPKRMPPGRSGYRNVVLTLVERGGSARSFHVDGATIATLGPIIRANIARETAMITNEWNAYKEIGEDFASHETVSHKKGEYVRDAVHTNTVEGYYSIFKRGMKGVYQHCSEKHLRRYLNEFDFRYSNRVALGVDDGERAARAMKGIQGKRLTYQHPNRKIIPFRRPEVQ
jgi:transposase-like protein